MKYVDTLVSFSEIPDEICLCINISNCPYHCPGCHSSYLAQDIGEELTSEVLDKLVEQNSGITCICIMGGKENEVLSVFLSSKCFFTEIKAAWYTGQKNMPDLSVLAALDYVKVGPYIEELGPLTSRTTNQRLYKLSHFFDIHHHGHVKLNVTFEDITSKFWKDEELS